MRILITGGLGYIGSHVVIKLIKNGHICTIVDDLSNSNLSVLDAITEICGTTPDLYIKKIHDIEAISAILRTAQIDCVVHVAGFKSVSASVKNPLDYYENNVSGTISLLRAMRDCGVNKIIFSSSAAVYGNVQSPLNEDMKTGLYLQNPYAKSKFMIEEILKDCVDTGIILRYFNPIGAHKSGLLHDKSEDNLMPNICRAAREGILTVFSGYLTPDQTAIRDYVHILDIARAHVNAVNVLDAGILTINLGFGKGISVKKLITTFQRVNEISLKIDYGPRRNGDLDISFADISLANGILNWRPKYSLEDMCRDSWNAFK